MPTGKLGCAVQEDPSQNTTLVPCPYIAAVEVPTPLPVPLGAVIGTAVADVHVEPDKISTLLLGGDAPPIDIAAV